MVDTLGLVNAVAGAPSYNGRKLRQLNGVGFAGATAARPLGARSGVRPGTPASTVTATASTWTVQPHAGLIDGQTAAEAGAYPFAFDAVATGPVAAASASFARVDIIYVQVDDPSESDGSTAPAVTRKYLAGTVANTPQALPARSILLAHINVPISGGGAPTVVWKAPYCAAAGAVVDFNTKAELDLWAAAPVGQFARVITDGGLFERTTTTWARVGVTPWQSYVPTWANHTAGNSVTTAQWRYVGDEVEVVLRRVAGTTASLLTNSSFTLPVAASSSLVTLEAIGDGSVLIGSNIYPLTILASSATTGVLRARTTGGTYEALAEVTNSIPAGLVTGTEVYVAKMRYVAA